MNRPRIHRVLAGVPSGGQFAAKEHSEAALSLTAPSRGLATLEAASEDLESASTHEDLMATELRYEDCLSLNEAPEFQGQLTASQSAAFLEALDSKRALFNADGEVDAWGEAADPSTSPMRLAHISSGNDYDANLAVAKNPSTSEFTLRQIMASNASDDFREAIARRPDATRSMLAWSARDRSPWVLNAVISNAGTSRAVLQDIYEDATASFTDASRRNDPDGIEHLKLAIRAKAKLGLP